MKTDVRTSSLEAYDELETSGKMGTQASKIWHWIAGQGRACTLQEISRGTAIPINAISGRVNALKSARCLHEWPRRACGVTNRNVIPVYVEPPPPEQLRLLEAA